MQKRRARREQTAAERRKQDFVNTSLRMPKPNKINPTSNDGRHTGISFHL